MGVLEGCDSFLKYLFFFFTFVFWLLGISAIGIGIWAVADTSFADVLDLHIPGLDAHALQKAAILLIVVGFGVMIVGFFGCCGAMKENQCLLVLFSGCLFLTFVLMVAGAVMAYGYQDTLEKLVKKGLAEMKKEYESNAQIKKSLDDIHQEFKCCEFSGKEKIPPSCYPNATTAAPPATTEAPTVAPTAAPSAAPSAAPTAAPSAAPSAAPTAAPTAAPSATAAAPSAAPTGAGRKRRAAEGAPYTADCSVKIMDMVKTLLEDYKFRIAGVGVASAIIVVIGMIVSMALCCKIKRGYQNV